MNAFRNDEISGLLGDFFQYHTNENHQGMESTLKTIEKLIFSGEADGTPFKDYFNDLYMGRSSFNINLAISDYPKESVLRELLQNTFGCYYEEKDIKVLIDFLEDGQVKLTYNEVGFNLQQILYYFGVGRNDGDRNREGRFGLGSKSVFINVEWFKLRSNHFNFKVVNDNGTIRIRELDMKTTQFKGTEIIFKISDEAQREMHRNLTHLTSEKGRYINMAEFAFAFIKKRFLMKDDAEETHDRSFNIAIMDNGKPEVVYKVIKHQKNESEPPRIRFIENGKSVLEFIWHENNNFVYLIPFAVSSAKREDVVRVLLAEHNYFSTFELTGLWKATGEEFIREKLSAFFISVPNAYITSHRSGIKVTAEKEVSSSVGFDLLLMIEKYKQYFVLELVQRQNSELYYMRPKHYVFEFFNNYIQSSKLTEDVKEKFNDNITLYLPEIEKPMTYTEVKKSGYYSITENVSMEEHLNGTARQKYLLDKLAVADQDAEGLTDLTVALLYNWEGDTIEEKGREFLYKFNYEGKSFIVESENNPVIQDFNLWEQFKNLASLRIAKYVVDNQIPDDEALENIFSVFDEIFGEEYRIDMRYFQLHITHRTSVVSVEFSKIVVKNLQNAIECISKRERRFESHQVYNEVISLLINSFTNGKDTMTFLREIKQHGGKITLALDINNRFRFSAYGKQFMIPPTISNLDLLEIIGDVYSLINCGMFNGRLFDFEYKRLQYHFDKVAVAELLNEKGITEEITTDTLSSIFVCNLSIDKIALIDNSNKIITIVGLDEQITPQQREKANKYIILRENLSKSEISDYIEFILTGVNDRILFGYYSKTEEPNQLLVDQIPFFYKPMPNITEDEFHYLRGIVKKISGKEKERVYKNYFVKDINHKLFGYGGHCPCCGYGSEIINSFVVKDFEVGLFKNDMETRFRFSLFMCANDSFMASGWIIEDVVIGGMSPFTWLEEIQQYDVIPSEYLLCKIYYRRQLTYQLTGEFGNLANTAQETTHEGAREHMDIVLTPLMAAKWVEDNKKH